MFQNINCLVHRALLKYLLRFKFRCNINFNCDVINHVIERATFDKIAFDLSSQSFIIANTICVKKSISIVQLTALYIICCIKGAFKIRNIVRSYIEIEGSNPGVSADCNTKCYATAVLTTVMGISDVRARALHIRDVCSNSNRFPV